MYYTFSLIVLAGLIAIGQSGKTVDGPCPFSIKKIDQSLDVERYKGAWYDVHVDGSQWIGGILNCTTTFYQPYNYQRHSIATNRWWLEQYWKGISTVVLYSYDFDIDNRLFIDVNDNPIYILDTDYDNYAVELGCFDNKDGISHYEGAIIRSRTKSISDELRDQLVQRIIDFGFVEPDFVTQDYNNCTDYEFSMI